MKSLLQALCPDDLRDDLALLNLTTVEICGAGHELGAVGQQIGNPVKCVSRYISLVNGPRVQRLCEKSGREFQLDKLDDAYLLRMPVATIRRPDVTGLSNVAAEFEKEARN